MSTLPFTKMHGCGNDFIILDQRDQRDLALDLSIAQIRRLCDRRFGVGCDQLFLLRAAPGSADCGYLIFNSDGSQAAQCGNGMRCVARFLHDAGAGPKIRLQAADGAADSPVIEAEVHRDGQVTINLGEPQFAVHQGAEDAEDSVFDLAVAERSWSCHTLSLGNPHAVIVVDSVQRAPLDALGQALQGHWQFPDGVNVGVCERVDARHLHLRVFERGAGETLACGSGACAAVAVMQHLGQVDGPVRVTLPGGELVIEWPANGTGMRLTGPAQRVFEGQWLDTDAGDGAAAIKAD